LAVLLPDRLAAYITWDRYLANLRRLEQNRSLHDTRGVPRRGEALLPGLVVCGKCGHRMTTRYKADKKPSYYCGEYGRLDLDEPCGCIAAPTLDDLVAREVLRALEPAALELSLRAIEDAEHERRRLHDQWRQTLERARQDVERAERRYHTVEPDYAQSPIMLSSPTPAPGSLGPAREIPPHNLVTALPGIGAARRPPGIAGEGLASPRSLRVPVPSSPDSPPHKDAWSPYPRVRARSRSP
jgi:hypothetical protein